MQRLGPVTRAMLALWAACWVLGFLTALRGPGLTAWLAFDAAALARGEWLALAGALTHPFAHDPYGLLHVLLNGLVFYWWAPEIETLWPRGRFVRFLLAAALAGAAANFALVALGPPGLAGPMLGGSGLVFAVLAANAAIYPGRIVNLILLRVRLLPLFLALCGLDLLWLIADLAGRGDGTAQEVHLAGAAAGWIQAAGFWRFGLSVRLPRGPIARLRARLAARRERRAGREEAELDRILAKIGREGLGSLERSEREFLERRSRRPKR